MTLDPACLLLACTLLLYLCDGTQSDEGVLLAIKQSPSFIWAHEGESINISCVVTLQGNSTGINIMRRYRDVMYFSDELELHSRVGNEFADRSQVSGTATNITITLHDLRRSDTDWYRCRGTVKTPKPKDVYGGGTVLIVADSKTVAGKTAAGQTAAAMKWEHSLLIAAGFVIVILGVIIIHKTRANKSHPSKAIPNTVYEDMSSTIRRNTMTRPHLNNDQNINGIMNCTYTANKNKGYTSLGLGTSGMACSASPY